MSSNCSSTPFATPLRCICRDAVTIEMERLNKSRRQQQRRKLPARKQSMSFSSDCGSVYSQESMDDSLGSASNTNNSSNTNMEADVSTGSAPPASIDDLMEKLVVEATQKYATTTNKIRRTTYIRPEERVIELAVERLNINAYDLADQNDADKTYYELRLQSDSLMAASPDLILSVLIGYACLNGMDMGTRVRHFTFQDSQHLYAFCELLGQMGRFEDAAF